MTMYSIHVIWCGTCGRKVFVNGLHRESEIENALKENGFHVFKSETWPNFEPDDDCILWTSCEECFKEKPIV